MMIEQEIKGIGEVVYKGVCDNGLKVFIWVKDNVQAVSMSLAVKYGSVHTEFMSENKKITVPHGSAHFLEHIKFNETSNSTAHEFFLKTGAEVNAFTTFDFTSYFVIAIDKIEENLIHLLDFVQNPFFTKELIEKEKGIILEEAKMGMDSPDNVSYFGIFKSLFKSSNYRNLITGNLEDIKSITIKDMENVFQNFYHPENMALFITGNVNPHEVMMIINDNQRQKNFENYRNPKILIPKEKISVNEKNTRIEGNVSEARVKIGLKIPRSKFKDFNDFDLRLALNLVMNMNFGSTSDLKDHLMENHLASKLSASADIYDEYVVIIVSCNTRFPDDISKIMQENLKTLKIDKEVFERKTKALIATYILNYDSLEKVNDLLQDDFITFGTVIDDAKEKFESLTIKNIEKIINLLEFNNISEHIMEPKKNAN